MEKEFIESNIVILGTFKPSKLDKLFFIKNDLINENDFEEDSVFTPELCRITTKRLFINISGNSIVIANKFSSTDTTINKIAKIIIQEASNASAIGLNFKWYIFFEGHIKDYSKNTFYPINSKIINSTFDTDDSAFGYYASKSFHKARMKLDIKPYIVKELKTNADRSILSFNFNFHIPSENGNLLDILEDFSIYSDEVDKIIKKYE